MLFGLADNGKTLLINVSHLSQSGQRPVPTHIMVFARNNLNLLLVKHYCPIAQELRGHLDDLVENYTGRGLTHSDAIDRALKDMGSPTEIGRGLHRAHRPQTDWLFSAMVGIYVDVTIFTTF